MAQDGAAVFAPLDAIAGAPGGEPLLKPLTAVAGAPGGEPLLKPLTVVAGAPGGTPAFAPATAVSAGFSASVAETGWSVRFDPLTASGAGSAGSVSVGDAVFAASTAAAYGLASTDMAFAPLEASATGLTGSVAEGVPYFAPMSVAAAGIAQGYAVGAGLFRAPTASAQSAVTFQIAGAPSFSPLVGAGVALVGGVATGSATFASLLAAAIPSFSSVGVGAASMDPMFAAATGSSAYSQAIRTWVMNAGNRGLTEYQSYPANSYAEFNGSYYATTDSGIFLLEGSTDDGTDIAWTFRTGLMDDRKASGSGLKRLEEVILATRFDGPLRIRVWSDDNSYFDYNVACYRPGVLHQVRAKTGRGARSRYYRVEVSGVGPVSAEVHSMQLPMIPLQRRLG